MRVNQEGNRLEQALLIKPRVSVYESNSTPPLIPNDGITRLTATGTVGMVMEAPYAGARKIILKSVSATMAITIRGSATTIMFGTGTVLSFDAASELIELVGLSTTEWAIVGNQNSVGVS